MHLGSRDCRLNPGWFILVQSSAGGSSVVEITCSDHGRTISGDGERSVAPNIVLSAFVGGASSRKLRTRSYVCLSAMIFNTQV
jgi:hypothetical protein